MIQFRKQRVIFAFGNQNNKLLKITLIKTNSRPVILRKKHYENNKKLNSTLF